MIEDRRRVVWFEGMTLDPHHFQQADRFLVGTLNARVRAAQHFDWGLTKLTIDQERLANGELVVSRCSGVMPDGYVFDVPETDPAPMPRNVADYFPPTQPRLDVYLALPSERQSGANFRLQDSENQRETRYLSETISVADENTGIDERQIEVGRSQFQIRFGQEPLQEYTTVQVASVKRDASGAFLLDETFVPATLSIGASARLLNIARRLLEVLVTKSAELVGRQQGILRQRELSPADLAVLGLMGSVNQHIPLLNHMHTTLGHPEDLYKTMLSLAGSLTTYLATVPAQPRDFPMYDHGSPTGAFNRLDGLLMEMLGGAKPQANYLEIPLTEVRENLYQGTLDDTIINEATMFLIARSDDVSEDQLVTKLPQMLRVASPEVIDAVLRSYIRGLTVEHTHRLPSGMPVDQQANYFQVQKRGPFWEAIQNSKSLSIFIPEEFSTVRLQLVAVMSP